MEGQRYTKKLNERQVTAVLKATCRRPHEREQSIAAVGLPYSFETPFLFAFLMADTMQFQLGVGSRYANDKFVKEFGISVGNQLCTIEGRVLPPPMVRTFLLGNNLAS